MPGRRPSYPWGLWFRKRRFTLRYGKHYHVGQSIMIQQVRTNASYRGLRIKIVEGHGEFTVLVEGMHPHGPRRSWKERIGA